MMSPIALLTWKKIYFSMSLASFITIWLEIAKLGGGGGGILPLPPVFLSWEKAQSQQG